MSDSRWLGFEPMELIRLLRSLADDLELVHGKGATAIPTPLTSMDAWFIARRAVPCIVGRTEHHPRIVDGHAASTSELFYIDPEAKIARTLSRWYRLKDPFPESDDASRRDN